jgi:V8-like Glu-specific endopeptidase
MIAGNFVTRSLSSTCLGTLINKTTVLTASRCYSSSIQYVENNMQFTIWQPTIVQNIVFFNARYFDEHLLPAADKYEIESFKVIHISLVILVKHYLIKI